MALEQMKTKDSSPEEQTESLQQGCPQVGILLQDKEFESTEKNAQYQHLYKD